MNTTITESPSELTLLHIQELISINIDSFNGFNEAARKVGDLKIGDLFRDLANDRMANIEQLQAVVESGGTEPVDDGSLAASIHRTILNLRESLGGGPIAVLQEAIRGEKHIKAKYEALLPELSGLGVTDLLHGQYGRIVAAHDRLERIYRAVTE